MSDITCYVYRCSSKDDMYIYLAEKDDFNCIPDELKKNLGNTELRMELKLNKNKQLAKENAAQVMENLTDKGFQLQMPSDTPISELLQKIAQNEQDKFKS